KSSFILYPAWRAGVLARGAMHQACFDFACCGLRAAQLLWRAAQPRVYILAV
ncbi:hypothetical protein A2U01_0072732, partial [Trifolium medium]|nr:hypothetical protein [Trifolium medium]